MTCDFMANPQSQKFNCVRKFYLTAQIFDPTAGPKGRRCQRLDPPPVRANQSDGNDGRSAPCARVGAVSGWFLGVSAASRAAFAGCLHPMARRAYRLKIMFVVRAALMLRPDVIDLAGDRSATEAQADRKST